MSELKKESSTSKLNRFIFIIMQLTWIISFLIMYQYNYTNNIFFNSFIFVLIVITNRFTNKISQHNNKFMKYIYITEFCFIIYLGLVIYMGHDYFTQYKILIVPALLLNIVQIFRLLLFKRLR